MSSISSIDTSVYSGLIESLNTTSGRNAPEAAKIPTQSSSDIDNSKVDLSNYYSDISMQELLTDMGANIAKSAEDLDNAMVTALENGFSVNDAVNIQKAKCAYEANCTVFNSTFELAI